MKRIGFVLCVILLFGLQAGAPSGSPFGEQSSLYRSDDGGATWKSLNLGTLGVMSIAIDPADPSTIYAGTEYGGVFKSLDRGATWHRSSDGLKSLRVNALGLHPSSASTLYAATSGGLFRSSDGALSWEPDGPKLPNPVFRSVAIDPGDSATHYAADAVWVTKSVDDGETWTFSTVGGDYVTSLVIDPAAPATLYAGVLRSTPRGGGIYRSTDGGLHWSFVSASVIGPRGRYYDVNALAVAPSGASIVYAGTSGGGVYSSADGGSSWRAINEGLGEVSVSALAIDRRNPATIYAAVDGRGVFKTTDGGAAWSSMTDGIGIILPASLAIDPSDPARVYAGLRGGTDASGARIARGR